MADHVPPIVHDTPESRFLGLSGIFRQWAGLGLAGIVAGLLCWAIVFGLPAAQDRFHDELREERLHYSGEVKYHQAQNAAALELLRGAHNDMAKMSATLADLLREIQLMRWALHGVVVPFKPGVNP